MRFRIYVKLGIQKSRVKMRPISSEKKSKKGKMFKVTYSSMAVRQLRFKRRYFLKYGIEDYQISRYCILRKLKVDCLISELARHFLELKTCYQNPDIVVSSYFRKQRDIPGLRAYISSLSRQYKQMKRCVVVLKRTGDMNIPDMKSQSKTLMTDADGSALNDIKPQNKNDTQNRKVIMNDTGDGNSEEALTDIQEIPVGFRSAKFPTKTVIEESVVSEDQMIKNDLSISLTNRGEVEEDKQENTHVKFTSGIVITKDKKSRVNDVKRGIPEEHTRNVKKDVEEFKDENFESFIDSSDTIELVSDTTCEKQSSIFNKMLGNSANKAKRKKGDNSSEKDTDELSSPGKDHENKMYKPLRKRRTEDDSQDKNAFVASLSRPVETVSDISIMNEIQPEKTCVTLNEVIKSQNKDDATNDRSTANEAELRNEDETYKKEPVTSDEDDTDINMFSKAFRGLSINDFERADNNKTDTSTVNDVDTEMGYDADEEQLQASNEGTSNIPTVSRMNDDESSEGKNDATCLISKGKMSEYADELLSPKSVENQTSDFGLLFQYLSVNQGDFSNDTFNRGCEDDLLDLQLENYHEDRNIANQSQKEISSCPEKHASETKLENEDFACEKELMNNEKKSSSNEVLTNKDKMVEDLEQIKSNEMDTSIQVVYERKIEKGDGKSEVVGSLNKIVSKEAMSNADDYGSLKSGTLAVNDIDVKSVYDTDKEQSHTSNEGASNIPTVSSTERKQVRTPVHPPFEVEPIEADRPSSPDLLHIDRLCEKILAGRNAGGTVSDKSSSD